MFESPLSINGQLVIQEIRNEQDLSFGNIRLWGILGYSLFAYILGIF